MSAPVVAFSPSIDVLNCLLANSGLRPTPFVGSRAFGCVGWVQPRLLDSAGDLANSATHWHLRCLGCRSSILQLEIHPEAALELDRSYDYYASRSFIAADAF